MVKVKAATMAGLDSKNPNDQSGQSIKSKRLKIKVATTNCVKSNGEMNKVKMRFMKNTKKSAFDDFDRNTFLSKSFLIDCLSGSFLEKTSHRNATTRAASK